MSDLLTLAQVADRLQVSKRTVRRAIDLRGLRAVDITGGGCWRVREHDLDDWLEQRAHGRPLPRLASAPAAVAPIAPRPGRQRADGRLAVTPEMGRTA